LTIIDDKGFIENECGHSYRSVVKKGEMTIIDDDEERVQAVKVLIDHFEKSPDRMMKKVNTKSTTWQDTAMFKFQIQEITGKERDVMPE